MTVIHQVATFVYLAEGQNVLSFTGKILFTPKNCSLSFEKSLTGRHPICGKTDAPTLLLMYNSMGHIFRLHPAKVLLFHPLLQGLGQG